MHLEQIAARHDRTQHPTRDFQYGLAPGIRGQTFSAWVLWYLGYPDQARERSLEALALARAMSHSFSLAHCLTFTAELHQFRREAQLTKECAEDAITLSTEQGFPFWRAWATILRGWALAEQGRIEEGMAQMSHGLAAYRATGAELGRPYFLGLLASAYANAGQAQAGLSVLVEAMAMVDKTGERYYEAELHRLKGELLVLREANIKTGGSASAKEAEACFHKAVAVAHHQDAKSLELRALLSLARLWQRQGKTAAARHRLAQLQAAFTEGFESVDLRQTKVLLDELL